MAKDQRNAGVTSSVPHEPLVSDTLKENAERHREEARAAAERARETGEDARTAPVEEGAGSPSKRHGDALETGTGNRQGVHEPDRRPETCD